MKYRHKKVYNQFMQTLRYYLMKDMTMFNKSMLECIKQLKIVNLQDKLFLNLMRAKFSLSNKKGLVKDIDKNLHFIIKENEILDKIKFHIESPNKKEHIKSVKAYNILKDVFEFHTLRKDNINKLINELKAQDHNLFEEEIHTFSKRVDTLK